MRVQLRDQYGNPLTEPVVTDDVPSLAVENRPMDTNINKATCQTYLGCGDPTSPIDCSSDLAGVYECKVTPQFAGPNRVVVLQIRKVDVSRADPILPVELNMTESVQGPFPMIVYPASLHVPSSGFPSLPRVFTAGVRQESKVQWRDVYGNDLIESPITKGELSSVSIVLGGKPMTYVDNLDGSFTSSLYGETVTLDMEIVATGDG